MSGYLLTPAADADLGEIWRYVHEHAGKAIADGLELDLHEAMTRIAVMPGMGHLRKDLADEPLRFITVHSYLIVYRSEIRPVQIIRVLHAARDVRTILESMD